MRTCFGAAALGLILAACGNEPAAEMADIAPVTETAPVETVAETEPPHPVHIRGSQELTIESALLGRAYNVRVQLPPGYDDPANADRRYPVLYLNDGPMNFLVATGVVTLPTNEGIIEELILVGIGYSNETGSTNSRVRDYTPTVNPAFERVTGGAGDYLEFIEQEVIPRIETTFRADPQRRALGGHSFGGLFGAYVLLNRPELFQHYILSSPSFWFNDNSIWGIEEAYAQSHTDLPAKVYVSIGGLEHPGGTSDYDMVGDVRTFERLLLSRGYPNLDIRATVAEGQNHETVFPTILMNGILWHFNTRRDIAFEY